MQYTYIIVLNVQETRLALDIVPLLMATFISKETAAMLAHIFTYM